MLAHIGAIIASRGRLHENVVATHLLRCDGRSVNVSVENAEQDLTVDHVPNISWQGLAELGK
jgi:hypothetical protein